MYLKLLIFIILNVKIFGYIIKNNFERYKSRIMYFNNLELCIYRFKFKIKKLEKKYEGGCYC